MKAVHVAQFVVNAIVIVRPANNVKIVPWLTRRREQKALARKLWHAAYFDANPVAVSQTHGKVQGEREWTVRSCRRGERQRLHYATQAIDPFGLNRTRWRMKEMKLSIENSARVINLVVEGYSPD